MNGREVRGFMGRIHGLGRSSLVSRKREMERSSKGMVVCKDPSENAGRFLRAVFHGSLLASCRFLSRLPIIRRREAKKKGGVNGRTGGDWIEAILRKESCFQVNQTAGFPRHSKLGHETHGASYLLYCGFKRANRHDRRFKGTICDLSSIFSID